MMHETVANKSFNRSVAILAQRVQETIQVGWKKPVHPTVCAVHLHPWECSVQHCRVQCVGGVFDTWSSERVDRNSTFPLKFNADL